MYEKKQVGSYYRSRHSCFLLQYHLVLVTKYRNPVLTGRVKDTVYEMIRRTCRERDAEIIEMNGEPDHVHVLFDACPDLDIMELVNVMKSRTARIARRDNPQEVAKYYWKPYFWSDSYFITSVGVNTAKVVKEYIEAQ